MLVIEGSDCLGKTILAKKIVAKVSQLGYPVVYSWMTRPNEQIFDFFNDYKKMINPCAVQDRFHLSGLCYHSNRIFPRQLQIINSWIRSVGGLIIVLYAGDEQRYEQRIREDQRGNLLSWPILCEANKIFKEYALTNDCDYKFDILPNPAFNYTQLNFVSDKDIETIVREWINRRELLGI